LQIINVVDIFCGLHTIVIQLESKTSLERHPHLFFKTFVLYDYDPVISIVWVRGEISPMKSHFRRSLKGVS